MFEVVIYLSLEVGLLGRGKCCSWCKCFVQPISSSVCYGFEGIITIISITKATISWTKRRCCSVSGS